MKENERDIIKQAITDSFNLREKYFDFQINTKFQLALAQNDLFKTISTIVIALLGIGYIFDEKFNKDFLLVSTTLIVFVLFSTLSFIREFIDHEDKNLDDYEIIIKNKTDETIQKGVESLEKDNFDIYLKFIKEKTEEFKPKEHELLYTGEIFNFLLYLSISFLVLSYISLIYKFNLLSLPTIFAVVTSYELSHVSWASKMVKIFSKKLR